MTHTQHLSDLTRQLAHLITVADESDTSRGAAWNITKAGVIARKINDVLHTWYTEEVESLPASTHDSYTDEG